MSWKWRSIVCMYISDGIRLSWHTVCISAHVEYGSACSCHSYLCIASGFCSIPKCGWAKSNSYGSMCWPIVLGFSQFVLWNQRKLNRASQHDAVYSVQSRSMNSHGGLISRHLKQFKSANKQIKFGTKGSCCVRNWEQLPTFVILELCANSYLFQITLIWTLLETAWWCDSSWLHIFSCLPFWRMHTMGPESRSEKCFAVAVCRCDFRQSSWGG